jgi:type IV secretion system protein VirD4
MNSGGNAPRAAGDTLILIAVAAALVVALLVDLSATFAAVITGSGWTWTPVGDMPGVLAKLPETIDEPRDAWPARIGHSLPSAAAMYAAAAVTALIVLAPVAIWLRVRRGRGVPSGAEWASRRDLRRLRWTISEPGRLRLGTAHGRMLAAEPRQSVLVVAPTQSGKTTALAIPAILDWQGPVVATSVKSDLVRDTYGHRASLGRAQVFDPTGATALSQLSSWSPLAGCRTWQGARRTAAWLTDAASPNRRGMTDGDFWYSTAAKLLAPLLFAAAMSGSTMEQVVIWLDRQEQDEVMRVLEFAECQGAIAAFEATLGRDERQRSSIYTTAETIIEAYEDPGVMASSMNFDINPSELLDGGRNTVYLCATARDQRRLRPVFVTLLQQILEEAYVRSSRTGTPLDPPLLVVLDEAANIAPISDLDVIAATGAGQGVQLLTVLQDLAQAYDRWGSERADTIVNNHRALLVGAGVSDARTLQSVGTLLGEQQVEQRSTTKGDGRGSETVSTSWRSLAPPNALRESAPGSAVLIYGSLRPAQIKLRPWFEDRRLRRLAATPADLFPGGEPSSA